MVVALGPGKFYGNSLPRPHFYTDIKFNTHRVDPPVSVMDPLLSWANEAHWSMGGLSLKRVRLQGKIEGNVEKLRKEQEKSFKLKRSPVKTPVLKAKRKAGQKIGGVREDSPPAAPAPRKLKLRSRVVDLEGKEDEEEEEVLMSMVRRKKRRLVRKLGDDFERVASENVGKKRSPLKVMKDVSGGTGGVSKRVSPRIQKRRTMVLMDEEEEDEVVVEEGEKEKRGDENGECDKDSEEIGSVSPKVVGMMSGEKGAVSPNGTRSSPRLKQKSS